MKIEWTNKNQLKSLARKYIKKNVGSLLDIGAGIHPQELIKAKLYIFCEPYIEYVEILQQKLKEVNRDNHIVLNLDWLQTTKVFQQKSVDSVLLYDVIEHLPKKEGKELLRKTEEIARKQIVIFTPLGFIKQEHPEGKDAWGLGGVRWQEHQSGWSPEDFDDTWKIFACKNYHFVNQLNQKLTQPHGAFYAIKTLSHVPNKMKLINKYKLHKTAKKIHVGTIKIYTRIFNFVYSVKKIFWKKPIFKKK